MLCAAVALLASMAPPFPAGAELPSGERLLEAIRLAQRGQNIEMTGRVRHGRRHLPFRLTIKDELMLYQFNDPPQTVAVRLGSSGSSIEETIAGRAGQVTETRLTENVRDTDITYEDISTRFLYWPNARITGEESVLTRRCWVVECHPGPMKSQYSRAILWVELESGALLRAHAFDSGGRLVKRFDVRKVQPFGGGWVLKEMRILAVDPATGRNRTPTYLEIQRVSK